MTGHDQNTLEEQAINFILDLGLEDGLPRVAEMLADAAMLFQRAAHLQAAPHERCEARRGYANGFKPRSLNTAMGRLELRVPRRVAEGLSLKYTCLPEAPQLVLVQ